MHLADARAFIAGLRDLGERERALLRHSINREPGADSRTWPIIEPLLPAAATEVERDAAYLVAALMVQFPRLRPGGPRRSFGGSLGRYAAEERARRGQRHIPADIERRFMALLDADAEGMRRHLRHLAALLRQHQIAVAWSRLLADLAAWDDPARSVQRAWMRHFLRVATRQEAPPPPAPEEISAGEAAALLGITPVTLRAYTKRGLLHPRRLNATTSLYDRAEVAALAATPRRGPGRPKREEPRP